MSPGIKILNGVSNWIRNSVGPEAENRGNDAASDSDETDEDDSNGQSSDYDAPACCSAASSTDVTVLDP